MTSDQLALQDVFRSTGQHFSCRKGERILRRYVIPRRRNGKWVWKEWGRYLFVQVIDRHSCEESRTWEPEVQS